MEIDRPPPIINDCYICGENARSEAALLPFLTYKKASEKQLYRIHSNCYVIYVLMHHLYENQEFLDSNNIGGSPEVVMLNTIRELLDRANMWKVVDKMNPVGMCSTRFPGLVQFPYRRCD